MQACSQFFTGMAAVLLIAKHTFFNIIFCWIAIVVGKVEIGFLLLVPTVDGLNVVSY